MIQLLSRPNTQKLLLFIVSLLITNLAISLDIPVLRQLLGFLFFTIVPGLLIIYIMKLNKLSLAEKIVLSIGISVSFLMIFGLAINGILLMFGYATPLSTNSLLISFSIAIIVLFIMAHLRNKDAVFSFPSLRLTTQEKALLVLPMLFPILSIAGARLMNLSNNNGVLVTMLFLILAYVIFISLYHHKISTRLYPGLIFLIGISLTLIFALRSNHIIGSDTHLEYYVFQITAGQLRWSPQVIRGMLEVCLNVSLLPVIYQSFLNIDPQYLFKVLYCPIVSILPIAVYIISKKYIGGFYAFLASIFIMSQTAFLWTEAEIRSNVATLFIALAVMVLFHNSISEFNKKVLYFVFAVSCIISHYSTSYVFLFTLVLAWVMMRVLSAIISHVKKRSALSISRTDRPRFDNNYAGVRTTSPGVTHLRSYITGSRVIFFLAIIFLWYSKLTTGGAFWSGVTTLRLTIEAIPEFFLAGERGAAVQQVIFGEVPLYQEAMLLRAEVIFIWLTIIIIAIGVLTTVARFKAMVATPLSTCEKPLYMREKFDADFVALSLALCFILVVAVALPFLSTAYGMGRTYFLAMVPLSLFLILGSTMLARRLKFPATLLILLVMIPYFMFISGLMYQLFGFPRAVTLNSAGYVYDTMYIHDEESYAIKWLGQNKEERVTIYSERIRLIQSQGGILTKDLRSLISKCKKGEEIDGYIFLRYLNVVEGQYTGADQLRHDLCEACPNILVGENKTSIEAQHKLYANGGSEIYRTLPTGD